MKMRPPTEHEEQAALFEWAELAGRPLDMLFGIANAGAGAQRGQAGKMKAEGVKPGVPDVMLAVARGGYHGLYIEMKRLDPSLSRVSAAQLDWHERLRAQGYKVVVAYGWEHARREILAYLAL